MVKFLKITEKVILTIKGVEWVHCGEGLYFAKEWFKNNVPSYGLTLKELVNLFYPNAKHMFLNKSKSFDSYRELVNYLLDD